MKRGMEITKETKASDLRGQYEELKSQVSRLGEKLKTMKDEEFLTVDFSVYEEDEDE